jgi:hypothetical protein
MARQNLEYHRNDFAPYTLDLGLLNYIVRYAGNPVLRAVPRQPPSGPDYAAMRKFILENSDISAEAKEDLEKFFTYSILHIKARDGKKTPLIPLNPPAAALIGKRTAEISNSVKCPPAYRVIPSVEILNPRGQLLVSNLELVKDVSTGGFVSLTGLDMDVTVGKSVSAGTTPIYLGSYELLYKFPQTSKQVTRQGVLKAIAENPDTLGYVFGTGREYTIRLKNIKPKNQKIPKKFQASCANLHRQSISIKSSTLKQELVEWNPVTNTAKFRITFARSVESRKNLDPSSKKVSTLSTRRTTDPNTNEPTVVEEKGIFESIIERMQKNNSLFRFQRFEGSLEGLGLLQKPPFYKIEVDTSDEQNPPSRPPLAYRQVSSGQFFLFRSLLVATLQTYSAARSPLKANAAFVAALYDDETYKNIAIGIDESLVDNELGAQLEDPGEDFRATHETIVVDIKTFQSFFTEMEQKYNAISFTDLMTEYFNNLVPKVMKGCVNKGKSSFVPSVRADLGGKEGSTPPNDLGEVLDDFGIGYLGTPSARESRGIKANFVKSVDLSEYGKTRRFYRETDIKWESNIFAGYVEQGSQSSMKQIDPNRYGDLKIKSIPSKVVSRQLLDIPATINKSTLLLQRNDSPSFSQKQFDPVVVRALNATNRRKLGIINVNWYNVLKKPTEGDQSAQFRLSYENGTPFTFSATENKHLETQAALRTKGRGVQLKLHTVSFSLYDVLGVMPYVTDFYFPPAFFGFGSEKEDLFGYVGYYKTTSAKISLQDTRFVTSLSADLKLDPQRLAEDKSAATKKDNSDRTTISKQIEAYRSQIKSLTERKVQITRATVSGAGRPTAGGIADSASTAALALEANPENKEISKKIDEAKKEIERLTKLQDKIDRRVLKRSQEENS